MAVKGFQRQRLLDVRDIMLQVEAVDLKQREDAHINERLQLEAALLAKEQELDRLTEEEQGSVMGTARDFLLRAGRTMELNQTIADKLASSKETATAVEEQRRQVEIAAKSKQTLEKLKEHQNAEKRVDLDRQDQKAMDEVAARKYLESSHGRATG